MLRFELLGEIRAIETIASGRGIHILDRLVKLYGRGNWRKLKGIATVRLDDGTIAEESFTGSKRTDSASAA
jgi:hypothetical protein